MFIKLIVTQVLFLLIASLIKTEPTKDAIWKTRFNGKEFHWQEERVFNFTQATDYCEQLGGSLINVDNDVISDYIVKKSNHLSHYWIASSNSSLRVFEKALFGQKALIHSGDDIEEAYVICERNRLIESNPVQEWHSLNGSQFYLHKQAMNFDDASKFCSSLESNLTQPKTKTELGFLYDLGKASAFWIGAVFEKPVNETKGCFRWQDGSAIEIYSFRNKKSKTKRVGDAIWIENSNSQKWRFSSDNWEDPFPLCQRPDRNIANC